MKLKNEILREVEKFNKNKDYVFNKRVLKAIKKEWSGYSLNIYQIKIFYIGYTDMIYIELSHTPLITDNKKEVLNAYKMKWYKGNYAKLELIQQVGFRPYSTKKTILPKINKALVELTKALQETEDILNERETKKAS